MLVGIDLGTTNSLVAYYADGKPQLIPNRLGGFLTPSVVAIDQDGQVLVGETAREYGYLHPLDVASTFKRSMGTDKEFQLDTRAFRAEELSSFVLRSLKEDAEVFLGCPVEDAIISVPAYFNDLQRKATKKAGELAGLNVVRIINEPTAAALAYGVGTGDKDERCLVFDLGGGTFDVSILEFFGTMMEVHAIAGDNFLGGEDFTQALARLFLSMAGLSLHDISPRELSEVNKAAEQAKHAFAKSDFVEMSVTINGSPLWKVIAIEEYEKACQPLLERLRKPIERSLRDADLHVVDIDRIVMVGGGTRLKMVRDYIGKLFLSFPEEGVDPDTAIAQGAALQCGMKERDAEIREVVLTDVCPFTLGTEVAMGNGSFDEGGHFLPIIERNTVIPVSRTQRVFTAHDNQEKVRVAVFQGESRLTKNNILLGELEMSVPRGPAGKEAVEITYTYDVNALLEVMVRIVSTDETRTIYIQNENTQLTDAEIAERMEKLAHLKQNPREEEQNKLALLRGERMYEECTGDERLMIGQAMANFDRALNAHDVTASNEQRKLLIKLLDQIEFGE